MDYKVYSVTELNGQIKHLIEDSFSLNLYLEGEITDYKKSSSGHVYFTLSDEKSRINCVMWRFRASAMPATLEKGTYVIIKGKLNVYAEGGYYSFIADKLDISGEGVKRLKLEQLKKKLREEGLFSPDRKKRLPLLPKKVGVVTAETGAAFRDIVKVLGRRNGFADIILAPCAVQGPGAPESIAAAIEAQNKLGLADVLIVGRGGGGSEDLSAFDDERVVRAVAASRIPVVSAVGHETDNSLTDLAADLRAETPSSAAEKVMENLVSLEDKLLVSFSRLRGAASHALNGAREYSYGMERRLFGREPRKMFGDMRRQLNDTAGRMFRISDMIAEDKRRDFSELKKRTGAAAATMIGVPSEKNDMLRRELMHLAPDMPLCVSGLKNLRDRLASSAEAQSGQKRGDFAVRVSGLRGKSPLSILEKGYSLVFKGGAPAGDISVLSPGDEITVILHDGAVYGEVKGIKKTGKGGLIEYLRGEDEKA